MSKIIVYKCKNCGEEHKIEENIWICRECGKEVCADCIQKHKNNKCK